MYAPASEELRKMLAGELYNPLDPFLTEARAHSRRLCRQYNATDDDDADRRRTLLTDLLGSVGPGTEIVPPFYCDYGQYITVGERVFLNFNCVLLDCNHISLGDRVLVGPGVHIYAATHPLDPEVRASGLELALG